MADQEKLIRMNALGTVHVYQEFAKYMQKDSVLLDVSFNSAYAIPNFLSRDKMILLAETDEEAFVKKLIHMSNLVHDEYKCRGFAYALSKNFVRRYAQMCAFKCGSRGIRVLSVSPGFVSTDMGNLEESEGEDMIRSSAEHCMGTPAELGYALAALADERNGYLDGVDILCDGGSIAGKQKRALLSQM